MSAKILGHNPFRSPRTHVVPGTKNNPSGSSPQSIRSQCAAITKAGKRCRNRPSDQGNFCARHSVSPVVEPPRTAPVPTEAVTPATPTPSLRPHKPQMDPPISGPEAGGGSGEARLAPQSILDEDEALRDVKPKVASGFDADQVRANGKGPRAYLQEILKAALEEMSDELKVGYSDPELRDLLRKALGQATGETPSGTTVLDLMGEIAKLAVEAMPFEQVRYAASLLHPRSVVGAMRRGMDVAAGLLSTFNPNHLAEVDEFGYDKKFSDRLLPFMELLFESYWRVDMSGGHNIPATGKALVVANHSGVVPWDAAMLVTGVHRLTGGNRHLRCLMLDLFATMPFLGTVFMKLGQIRACPENGMQLLNRGHVVGVFPEGLKGIGKLYRERYKLQRFGRGGYVRLAIRGGAPIIPAAVIGGEEIYPLFYRADWLARLFNFPYFPVTLTFPWLGLLGVVPLPSKWLIQLGEPVTLDAYGPDDAEDDLLINDLSDQIKTQIQDSIYTGLRRRRSVFLG